MNKRISEVFKRLPIVSTLVVTSVAGLIGMSVGSIFNDDKNTDVKDLINDTKLEEWYNFDAEKEINRNILSGRDGGAAPVNLDGGYCIAEAAQNKGNTTYKIVNIIDINNDTEGNEIKIYGSEPAENGGNGETFTKTYSFSHIKTEDNKVTESSKPFLMLAYLAQQANNVQWKDGKGQGELSSHGWEENDGKVVYNPNRTSNQNGEALYMKYSYKAAMPGVFFNDTYREWMENMGMSNYITPPTSKTYDEDNWLKLKEANQKATEWQQRGKLSSASMTKNNVNIKIVKKDGVSYVGPYRVGLNDCTIGQIFVNEKEINEVYTSDFKSKSVDSISVIESPIENEENKTKKETEEFYIKVENGTKQIKTKIVAKEEVVTSIKARIMIIGGGESQNFMIYRAEEVKENPEVDFEPLDIAPVTGKMEIVKRDQFDRQLNLSGIEFKIRKHNENDPTKGWVTGKDENGNATFGKYDDAHAFVTDEKYKDVKEARVDELDSYEFEFGEYEVYETKIPDQLKDYYQLSNQNIEGNMQMYVEKIGPIDRVKDIVELKEGDDGIASVQVRNMQAYRKLEIEKRDADTRESIDGVQFKLYKTSERYQKGYWVEFEEHDEDSKTVRAKDNRNTTFESAGVLTAGKGEAKGYTQVVEHLPIGKYIVYETDLGGHTEYPAIGTTKVDGKEVTATKKDVILVNSATDLVQNDATIYRHVENEKTKIEPDYGVLEINKKDEFDGKLDLSGLEFIIHKNKPLDQKFTWVTGVDEDGIATYGDVDSAKVFITNSEGKIPELENIKLELGEEYHIFEVGIPERLSKYYRLDVMTVMDKDGNAKSIRGEQKASVKLTKSYKEGNTEVEITNNRDFGSLQVFKTNFNDGADVGGIQFKLYKYPVEADGTKRVEDGYWVQFEKKTDADGKVEFVAKDRIEDQYKDEDFSFNNATPLTVDEKTGYTEIVSHLPEGKYAVYETSLGGHDEFEELGTTEFNGENIPAKFIDDVTVEANKDEKAVKFEVTNPPNREKTPPDDDQKTISISGMVWEDVETGKNTKDNDNKYIEGTDLKVNGITVNLVKNSTREVVATTTTWTDGTYKFKNVKVSELKNLHVEFEYDGITYQNVEVGNYGYPDTSKASEEKAGRDLRSNLNNVFTEIKGQGQNVTYNGKEITLTYSKKKIDDEHTSVTSDNICERNENENNKTVTIPAGKRGDFLITSATDDDYLDGRYVERTREILYVNLGLVKREMPDLSLTLASNFSDINTDGITYTYFTDREKYSEGTETNKKVYFGNINSTNHDIKDIKYNLLVTKASEITEDEKNTRSAYITYALGLSNNSTTLNAKVNAINEYFSNELIFEKMYMVDENGQETAIEPNKLKTERGSEYTKYVFEDLDIFMKARSSKVLYITFKLPFDRIYNLSKEEINNLDLINFAEIASYSVYEKDSLYAGFDVDSIPNNFVPGDVTTDEDDDHNAPTLHVKEKDGDTPTPEPEPEPEPTPEPEPEPEPDPNPGDGDKQWPHEEPTPGDGDKQWSSISGIVFEDLADEEKLNDHERIGNGQYDEGESSVANVKVRLLKDGAQVAETTTGDDGQYTFTGIQPGTYNVEFAWGEGENTIIKKGNEGIIVTVNDYKSTTVDKGRWNDSNWFTVTTPRYSDALDNYDLRKSFDSKTSSLYDIINNEPVQDTSKVDNKAVMKSTTQAITISEGDTKFAIQNVDFGIIERPRQSMNIEKSVESLTITTAQGQVIADAIIDENGDLQVKTGASITGGPSLGYVKSEMDAEIIDSGTVAKVGYNIAIKNTSEKDYDDENYYKFGIKNDAKIVKLKAFRVYDRLKGLAADIDKNVDSDGNATWEIVDKTEDTTSRTSIFQTVGNRIYNEGEGSVSSTSTDWTEWHEVENENGKMLVRERASEELISKVTEWIQDSTITAKYKSVTDILTGEADVIAKLNAEDLIPAQDSRNYKFYGSSTISSLNEIRFDNAVEVTDIQRDGDTGRIVAEECKPYDEAEYVTITPPTGENRDYVLITMVSITAITILGVGIVLIKKVLKQ